MNTVGFGFPNNLVVKTRCFCKYPAKTDEKVPKKFPCGAKCQMSNEIPDLAGGSQPVTVT